MKKLLKLILIFLGLISLDYLLSLSDLAKNKHNYLLGYENFYSKAKETKGQKRIILVGGSSLSWGVSAKELSKELNVLTLNSGIHAGIGWLNYFDVIEKVINKEKDIFIVSPEYDGMRDKEIFFRSKAYCEIMISVIKNYPIRCIGYSLNKVFRVFPTLDLRGEEYNRSGFNKYGDYIFRKNGVSYQLDKCNHGSFSHNILTNKYLPYLNNFKKKGYKIFYIPTIISKGCGDLVDYKKFHYELFNAFGVKGFNDAKLEFDKKYFFNNPYHLTKKGVKKKTLEFKKQLQALLIFEYK